jgi:hypothetical protein
VRFEEGQCEFERLQRGVWEVQKLSAEIGGEFKN